MSGSKRFLEMRGADAGSFAQISALPALWTGLLYDQAGARRGFALTVTGPWARSRTLCERVPRQGLRAPFRGGTVLDLARIMVTLAEGGLKRRARLTRTGEDERKALTPLIETIEDGRSPADRLLAAYHRPWAGDIDKIFDTQAL